MSSEVASAPVRVEIPRGFRALPEAAYPYTYQLLTEVPTGGCSDECDKKDQ
jgi:hypothetical protein